MIQKPKGTYDVTKENSTNIIYIEKLLQAMMEKYNYQYMRTPIFEASELFHRGVGETTDIVTKETYDFQDRGDRSMTLRPEGTAGIVRSFIENKLYGNAIIPEKYWYYGPMYRYERPQAGRFREFYQFGVEVFGTTDPIMDAEVISIPVNIYRMLGLKGIKVQINSLGDKQSRENYHHALVTHFEPHIHELCEDCQKRFAKNPLRILDCKIDRDKEIIKTAPKMTDYLNEESRHHFEMVQKYLTELQIPFQVNPKIVRGLDYYTHTVFEVEADIKEFGSQNVLCGGGRYDHLVENIGGPATPGVGFALGMERLLDAINAENITLEPPKAIDTYLMYTSEQEKPYAFALTQNLRLNGFTTDMDYITRNIKASFKQADRMNAKYIIIIGENELKDHILTVKNNQTKEEYKIKEQDIITFLDEHLEQ